MQYNILLNIFSWNIRAKGERYYDWALVAFQNLAKSGFQKALLFRRSIEKPDEIAYYICHYTPSTKIEEVVRVAGSRWAIESAFEQAKQQVGLDQYEVRLWTGWYRHMTLCMFSYAFLRWFDPSKSVSQRAWWKVCRRTLKKTEVHGFDTVHTARNQSNLQ